MLVRNRTRLFSVVGSLALAVLLIAALWQATAATANNQYPPAPFAPCPADFPRLIAVREAPCSTDEVTRDQFVAEQKAVRRFITEEGAAAHASEPERKAIEAAFSGQYARAREGSKQVLKDQPQSIPALLSLAMTEAFDDGNLARGLFLVRQARAQCEQLGALNPNDADARQWYLLALDKEYQILEDLGRSEEQLVIVDRIEAIYQPMPMLRIWRFIKLRRFVEAAEAIRQAEAQGGWTTFVLNCRCALASEMQDRTASFDAAAAMVAQCGNSPVLWSNYGSASVEVFRFDEAERAYLRCATIGEPNFLGTSYHYLNFLFLQQGRIAEAVDTLKAAKKQRSLRQPYTLQQDEATSEMGKALLMLVLGRNKDAVRHAKTAFELPDRGGSKSSEGEVLELAAALGYLATLQAQTAELSERGELASGLQCDAWMVQRTARTMTTRKLLVSTLRPYLSGGAEFSAGVPSWLRVSIVQLFPPGVVAEAVRQARGEETHELAIPYLDAADAEVHLLLGDRAGALELAHKALAALPPEGEKLLRARVALVAAKAAFDTQEIEAALQQFETALRDFPAVIRMFDAALPVRFEPDGQEAPAKLVELLGRSPRFVQHEQGWRAIVEAQDEAARLRILRADGTEVAQAVVELKETSPDALRTAAAALQQQLLSPSIDLTQSDLSSLNGSPFAARTHDMIDRILAPARPK